MFHIFQQRILFCKIY